MRKYTIIILLALFFESFFNHIYSQPSFNPYFLSEKEEIPEQTKILTENQIINAIYVIRNYNGDKNLNIEGNTPTFLSYPRTYLKKNFRIYAVNKNTNKISKNDILNSDDYFCIEDKENHQRIGIKNQFGEISLFQISKNPDDSIDDNCLWKIFPKIIEENIQNKINRKIYYYIQNRANGKYLSYVEGYNRGTLICNFDDINKFTKNNYFIFNRMYREKSPNESLEILDKEPVDVLIKYIDLLDPNLKREGIPQIKKDQENGEIKYCVRSILKNIPWIRKIFILMPNEKIRYFKEPEEIKEKIVYVKDKDLIGFDSGSSPVFQFNLWKMKQFGLSENFILMDDDYFIGLPLKKSNFFYEENGKVYPASVTGDYYELNKKALETDLKPLLAKIGSIGSHSPDGFAVMQKTSLLFLYKIFGDDETRYGKPLIEASFSHNAIPVKQSDIKEIYDYIVKLYPYAKETLGAKNRHIRSLQPQTIFLSYAKNKYDRRVKIISSKFYDLTQFKGRIESELFVINTSDRKYSPMYYNNEIQSLEHLFPEKTPYEIGENNKKENTNQNKNQNQNINQNKNINKNQNITPNKNTNQNSNQNKTKNQNIIQNKNQNKNQDKKEKKNITKIIDNKSEDKNKNDNKNDINKNVFEFNDTLNYLKNKYNKDLLEIKNKIEIISEKFDKEEKKIEELIKKVNGVINKNITLSSENKIETYSKNKIFEILLIIIILICLVVYLYNKRYFNEINSNNNMYYYGRNGFGNINNDRELNFINSKLIL